MSLTLVFAMQDSVSKKYLDAMTDFGDHEHSTEVSLVLDRQSHMWRKTLCGRCSVSGQAPAPEKHALDALCKPGVF